MKSAVCAMLLSGALAFPWVADSPGVSSPWTGVSKRSDKPLMATSTKRDRPTRRDDAQCPYNSNHVPAAPFNKKYPYNGAVNGQQGNQKGGYQVPAKGDKAHKFIEPGPNDIRGPCPGLNAMANHNFLARDGITTFDELVDAQQNVYNVGYDLANLLAALGLTLTDGDVVTEKLSIGCDATSRTSFNPALTGAEPGLDGHNKFEGDTSLTRDDYFLGNGDNYSYNNTLFTMMDETCDSTFDLDGLALYRYQRYQQSLNDNPNFFFGPLSLLLFGAASFLYELMPNGNHDYKPDLETISYFFGAKKTKKGFAFNNHERIPPNWVNRVEPYTNNDVTNEILKMYSLHPVLFGGNTGDGSFDTISFGSIQNGSLPVNLDPEDTACLLYQLISGPVPGYLHGLLTPSVKALEFVASKVAPSFSNLGCPIPLNS